MIDIDIRELAERRIGDLTLGYFSGISGFAQSSASNPSIWHGFTGSELNFRGDSLTRSTGVLCTALALKSLFVVKQTHGAEFHEIHLDHPKQSYFSCDAGCVELGEADAIIAYRGTNNAKYAVGVRTADCVPILISSSELIACIHAGWRGLAGGIVQRVIERVLQTSDEESCTFLIGPNAGARKYEVGAEVISAIGEHAVCTPVEQEKFLLDMNRTVASLIASVFSTKPKIVASDSCTISDSRYHSYRRNGAGVGSNLSFLLS